MGGDGSGSDGDSVEEIEQVSLTAEQLADHLAFMEGLGQQATDKGYMPPMDIMRAYGVNMDPSSDGDPSTVTVREEEPGEQAGRVPTELSVEELHAKGNAAMKESDYVSALDMYTEALESVYLSGNPCLKLHVLFANRSAAHLKLGDAKAAAEDAESAVSASPKYTKGWFRLASAHAMLDSTTAMGEAVRKGLELDPTNRELLEMQKSCPPDSSDR